MIEDTVQVPTKHDPTLYLMELISLPLPMDELIASVDFAVSHSYIYLNDLPPYLRGYYMARIWPNRRGDKKASIDSLSYVIRYTNQKDQDDFRMGIEDYFGDKETVSPEDSIN